MSASVPRGHIADRAAPIKINLPIAEEFCP